MDTIRENMVNDGNSRNIQDDCFGMYSKYFREIPKGKITNLTDELSEKNVSLPVRAMEEQVYFANFDRDLVSEVSHERRCDYIVVSSQNIQTCFVELKGSNIRAASRKRNNPYDQLIDSIKWVSCSEELKSLLKNLIHTFIVSREHQVLPRGVDSSERKLWRTIKNMYKGQESINPQNLVHYVKVMPKAKYSDTDNGIICSTKDPLEIPYTKR